MSALSHLCLSLLGGDRERVVCVVSNYFTCHWDESGSDPGTTTRPKSDLPILVVSGYLAHVKEWELLESDWRQVLDEYGLLSKGFHMVTFANNKKPYSEWEDDKKECLIGKLLDIIDDYPRLYVSFGVSVGDYFEIIKARNLLGKVCAGSDFLTTATLH